MSTDLRARLTEAVGDVAPQPVDTTELWRRGRRQRRVRQVAPLVAVLTIVGLGVGALVTVVELPDPDPLAPIGDGRDAGPQGWTEVPAGAIVDVDGLTAAAPEDVEVVTTLLGHPAIAMSGFDVREDGAVVTILHDQQRGGVVVRYPQDPSWTRIGMPAPFLWDDAGYAVNSVQWGPDGRIYLTGMAPDADSRSVGLTQVAVIEEDGTVVGVRENDAGQTDGFLFVDGYAWQRQQSDPGQERWQPVAEIGGKVLQMPDQRAGEWDAEVAPDGMVLTYDPSDRDQVWTFRAVIDDDTVAWGGGGAGIGVWSHAPAGTRIGATMPTRPGSGALDWLTDATEPDGVVVHALSRTGELHAVHLPPEVTEDPWNLLNGVDAVIGRDGRLAWVTHTPEGPVLVRYRHPLP